MSMHTVHGYVLALYDANGGNACTWGLWSLTDINRGEPSTGFYGYKNTQGTVQELSAERNRKVYPATGKQRNR